MPKHTDHSTYQARIATYSKIEQHLMQAQALNLALQTSGDVHEQMKPIYGIMSDLLTNITTEMNNMWDEFHRKES